MILSKNKKLLEKAIDEYIDDNRLEFIKNNDYDLHPQVIETMKFAGKYFEKNYEYILKIQEKSIKKAYTKKIKYYKENFEELNHSIGILLSVYKGVLIHKKNDYNPKKCGMLSEWVDWYYMDDMIKTNEKEHVENVAVINNKGKKFLTEWENHMMNGGMFIDERVR